MDIDSKLKSLRTKLRHESKDIIDHIIKTQVSRNKIKSREEKEICIFCGSSENLTKEHVIPKWMFEKDTKRFFITDVNESEQTYNKTTIPACRNCNNDLSYIESYIINLFKDVDLTKSYFSNYEKDNIIRWLEIIEYKFQVLEVRRKFVAHKKSGFIPYLVDFPISVMRESVDYSPSKVISQIRLSQKRVTIKAKVQSTNSLVVFKTKNKSFHFLHNMNEFIFFELPKYKIALFYFYCKTFRNELSAYKTTMKIIKKVY